MKPRELPPVVGSLNLALGSVKVAPVTPPDAYLNVSRLLWPGVEALAAGPLPCAAALTLVSGHVLECILKAFLARQGVSEADLKKPDIRHNLVALWCRAHSQKLAIGPTPPPWVDQLSGLHNQPYNLRYPMRFHGLVLPGREPMVSELRALLELVAEATQ